MLAASFVRLKENKNNGKRRYYWRDLRKRGEINIHVEKGSSKTKCKFKVILSKIQNNQSIKTDSATAGINYSQAKVFCTKTRLACVFKSGSE